ncbi:hypothetical protein DFH07DRAFT_766793 [Mycena maculata]|uniref:Uncharacterized protein n=1 Tax=Mycena maculata TaxID=230809 RepID=A0AAD7NVA0_9AGAR|nr:hypothetical protein DFH07DRAFT_766793 [Mycena maculata]
MAPAQSRIQGAKQQRERDKKKYTCFPGRRYEANGKMVKLEDLYLVPNHPQRRNVPGGRTYIFYQDTSEEGCKKTWEQEKDLEVPLCSYKMVLNLGYLELIDRDAVFSRSLHGSQDPMQDVIQVWVTGERLYTREQKTEIENARDTMLGPKSLRTRKRAYPRLDTKGNPTGPVEGGTAYERSTVAVSVKPPARVYTIGPSVEAPTSIMGPARSSKVPNGLDSTQLLARNTLLRASSAAAMAAAREAPEQHQRLLKEHSELIGKPHTGSADNWAYSTVQNNIAPAKQETEMLEAEIFDKAHGSLSSDLGEFGEGHIDSHDHPVYDTHMASCHDVPSYYEPGLFFILQLGVFIRVTQYSGLSFTGLRKHGGTPPKCPIGKELRSWAYRFVMIHYPAKRMLNGTTRYSLGALPKKEPLIVAPEWMHAGTAGQEDWSPPPTTGRATFIREGAGMMEPMALVTFVVHALIAFCFYVLNQLPAALEVEMDPDLITRAITFKRRDGRRVNTGQWGLAPGHRAVSDAPWEYESSGGTSQAQARGDVWVRWLEYEAHVWTHIPYLGRRPYTPASLSKSHDSDEELDEGGDSAEDSNNAKNVHKAKTKKKKKIKKRRTAAVDDSENEGSDSEQPKRAKRKRKVVPPPADTDEGTSAPETEPEDEPPKAPSAKALGKRKAESATPNASTDDGSRLERQTRSQNPGVLRRSSRLQGSPEDVEMVDVEQPKHRTGTEFVSVLNLEALEGNLCEVEYCCMTFAVHPEPLDMRDIHTRVAYMEQVLRKEPNSDATPAALREIWKIVGALEHDEAQNALEKRSKRASVMITNYCGWEWLDGYCPAQIARAVQARAADLDRSCWISRLAADVKCMVEIRAQIRTFDPRHYGLAFPDVQPYLYECARPPFATSPEETLNAVQTITTNIIIQWFNFPVNTLSRQQAWFVHVLLKTVGSNALLLDEVWSAYISLRKNVLGALKRKDEMYACIMRLELELRKHPLCIPNSPEREILNSLASKITEACSERLQCWEPMEGLGDAPLSVAADVQMPSPGHPEPAEQDPIASHSEEEDEDKDSESGEENDEDNDNPLVASEQLLARFLVFLRDAAALQGSMQHPNEFQQHLMERMDYIYPFRELAPSRQRSLQSDGPFTPERARTDAGMFSGAVYRGITFGTEFQFEYSNFFEDIEEFNAVKKQATEIYMEENLCNPPANFFCDSAAFGPPNHQRKIELADIYAKNLTSSSWEAKFKNRAQVPFMECWSWLKDGKQFPVLGPLAGYLLTADLSYTGAVTPPTLDEMITIVWELNKGAVAGLEELHLIPLRTESEGGHKAKADKVAVGRALRLLYRRLQRELSKEMKQSVAFDVIVLEHALCKFSRCLVKNWFRMVPGKKYFKRKRLRTPPRTKASGSKKKGRA